MKALIQRVKKASVKIEEKEYSAIGNGILLLLGVTKEDSKVNAQNLAKKVANLRIFEDENQKMNYSLLDVKGEALIVSQFTLCGDCKKGTRPSFDNSAPPDIANKLYELFIKEMETQNISTKHGVFGADMKISLLNEGPVTFMLEF